jgi:thiamine kinase-like enzyme
MKISVLLEREPFDKIFEKTFASFLESFTNHPHKVKWSTKKYKSKNNASIQQWYCNPLINSIFTKGVNPSVFDSINGEYSYNPLKPWRSSIQKLYLYLSQNKITSQLLAKYIIQISPPINYSKNKLIIGGNTKIRLIDISEKKVYVILKNGFDKNLLEKELYVRNNFKYLPIPKINTFDPDGLWYSEEYVSGKSPNRLEANKRMRILMEVVQHIHKMLDETKQNVSLSEYVVSLKRRINKRIDQISYIDTNVRNSIKYVTTTLVRYFEKYPDQTLTVAYCHGDFHQGNILSNGKDHWILDWENSGQKQIGYDLFILLLESRIESGFTNRFLKLLNNQLNSDQQQMISNWPEIEWDTRSLKERDLILFLLEELDFYVNENSNILFTKNPRALSARLICFKEIFDSLPFNIQ